MPPKKKKTQLKPVARGFATTSVPKKVVPGPVEDLQARNEVTGSNSTLPSEAADPRQPGPPESTRISNPVDLEQRASQSLLEKYQERIEKDISR